MGRRELRFFSRKRVSEFSTAGSPIKIVVWYFQIAAGEIRVIDIAMNLDLTPAVRVAT